MSDQNTTDGSPVDYNKVTFLWGDSIRYGPACRHRRRLIEKALRQIEFKSVLDVGCAQPYLLESLAGQDKELFGCDIADNVVVLNRKVFKQAQFETVDISKETYPGDRKFDLVVCSEVIEHIKDWPSAVRHLAGMARKFVVLTVPAGERRTTDRKVGHIQHFTGGELREELEKHGLTVKYQKSWGFPLHSAYRVAINMSVFNPEKLYDSFVMNKYGFFQIFISRVLYGLFYVNDLFHHGSQLILVAERK